MQRLQKVRRFGKTLRLGYRQGIAKKLLIIGYNLPAKHVIHTVGPQTEDPKLLRSCYERSLKLAHDNKLDSIAFPCVSTGVYGYDKTKAANVALQTTLDFFTQQEKQNDETVRMGWLNVC